MAVSDIRLITVTCDVTVCDNDIACGADPTHARKNGWHQVSVVQYDVDGVEAAGDLMDMCPTCWDDLNVYLNGETEPVAKAEDSPTTLSDLIDQDG